MDKTLFKPPAVCVCVCVLTDVAVLSGPALVTLTLALFTHSVLAAQRMAGLLVAHASRPALLAATHAAVANTVGAAVHLAHLCRSTNTHTQAYFPRCRTQNVRLLLQYQVCSDHHRH